MNTYKMSDGNPVTKYRIDQLVRATKKMLLEHQREAYGYNFCETCGRNDDVPIDCAHIVSVKECQESGRAELAWDITNMVVEGRECHKKRDNLRIGGNK